MQKPLLQISLYFWITTSGLLAIWGNNVVQATRKEDVEAELCNIQELLNKTTHYRLKTILMRDSASQTESPFLSETLPEPSFLREDLSELIHLQKEIDDLENLSAEQAEARAARSKDETKKLSVTEKAYPTEEYENTTDSLQTAKEKMDALRKTFDIQQVPFLEYMCVVKMIGCREESISNTVCVERIERIERIKGKDREISTLCLSTDMWKKIYVGNKEWWELRAREKILKANLELMRREPPESSTY